MYIQKINITGSPNYYKKNISMKKVGAADIAVISSPEETSLKRDAAIIDYLERSEKREKQAPLISAAIMLGTIPLFIYFMRKSFNGDKKKNVKDLMEGFKSLKEDNSIPTLDTCKSINAKLRDFLQKQLTYDKATPEDIKKLGGPKPAKKMLLYGPAGTGKTYFAKIYAKTLDAEYMEVKYSDLNHRYVGHHLENIKTVFEDIIKTARENKDKKYVVTFNEIDAIIVPQHQLKGDGGHNSFKKEERNVFLNYLDEVAEKAPNVTIIGTTNGTAQTYSLDGAAMSRFANKLFVDYPNTECLFEALKAHFAEEMNGKFVSDNEQNLIKLAESMSKRKFSFRDLDYMVDDAKNYRLQNYINKKDTDFKFEYLEKAKDARDVTDGEAAGLI